MTAATAPAASAEGWMRRSISRIPVRRWIGLAPVVIFLSAMMFLPVGELLLLSVQSSDGELTLQSYRRLSSSNVYVDVLLITFKISAWTTLITVVCSYPVAYMIARTSGQAKSRLIFWILLSFWTSFLVRTFGWLVMLGRNGLINQFLVSVGLIDAPIGMLYTLPSVIVGMSHAMMPLCILIMVSVMETIDRNLSLAALTLGARPGSAFWRIYFPLSLPGVAAGGLLVFITSLGFFITPAFLGGPYQTMITQVIIQQVQELLNWRFAAALSLLLLVAALVVFFIYDRILGLSTLAGEGDHNARSKAGRGGIGRLSLKVGVVLGRLSDAVHLAIERLLRQSPDRPRKGLGSSIQWVVVLAMIAFLSVPAFIMVPVSFTTGGTIEWPPQGFGLGWYETLYNSPLWVQAAMRSIVVAIGTACLAMLIGAPAAFALASQKSRGNSMLLALILSPLIIPRMIIAVALFYLYARIGLVGTYLGLILGHTVLAIPFVVITVLAVLKNYDDRYDKAAYSLGAGRIRTFHRITAPLIRAGLISAFLFAFITSFDELTIALFVTGGLTTTLPKQMWDDAILSVNPTLAAASTMILLFVTALIVVADRMQKRSAGA